MSAITSRVFAVDGTKKALVLGGEEFCRTLQYGSNWNWLRIAMSYALTPNGTSNITGARFVVSLISGKARTYTHPTGPQNCLGFLVHHSDESAGRTLTYTANSGNPYYSQSTDRGYYFNKNGLTTQKTAFINKGGLPHMLTTTGSATQRRAVLLFDFIKNTPTGSGAAVWRQRMGCTMDNTSSAADNGTVEQMRMASYLTSVGTQPFSAGSGVQWTDLVSVNADPNEGTNGFLDTVSIFWNQTAYPLEIYSLNVFRIR